MEKTLTCCFTGHRALPKGKMDEIRTRLSESIDEMIQKEYTCFISGGAVGFDLLAAELVVEKKKLIPKLRLRLVLPCKNQDKGWSRREKTRYEAVLENADDVVFVCEEYCTGCMHLRNREMVRQSDACIAYFSHGGGTGHTIGCAREKGIEIINLAHIL